MLTEEMVRAIEEDRRREIDASVRRHRWLAVRRKPRLGLVGRLRAAADAAAALLPSH